MNENLHKISTINQPAPLQVNWERLVNHPSSRDHVHRPSPTRSSMTAEERIQAVRRLIQILENTRG